MDIGGQHKYDKYINILIRMRLILRLCGIFLRVLCVLAEGGGGGGRHTMYLCMDEYT